jgi:hypothetical protein
MTAANPASPPPSSHSARGWFRRAAALAALLSAIVLLYLWLISAGLMTSWPEYTAKYDLLADAFLHGQTHLLLEPPSELLALSDPYDPVANAPYRLHDALLYRGHYYLYWGPAPALLAALVKGVAGFRSVPDASLVFAFLLGYLLSVALLLFEVRRQYFPALRWGMVLPGILVAALGNPLPFLLARAGVYEAAITGGQFFLVAGLYWGITAFRGKWGLCWRLALAGLCWALAVHCRLSLGPAVAVLTLLLVWRLYRRSLRALPFCALAAPLVLGAFLLGLYNDLRFGSWTDFGLRYQLSGLGTPAALDPIMTSSRYVLPNASRYLFGRPQLQDTFPFVTAPWRVDPVPLPPTFHIPYYYLREPVAGICFTSPFALLAALPLLFLVRSLGARLRSRSAPPPSRPEAGAGWVALLLACAALLGIAPPLFLVGSTMRYLADTSPALLLLATLGFWQLDRLLEPSPVVRTLAATGAGLLLGATVLCGTLLGVTGYYNHFQVHNPQLLRTLKMLTLPRWRRVLITDLVNPNWVESRRGKRFFWMGQGDTVLEVWTRRQGILRITATFEPGPCGPARDTRDVLLMAGGKASRRLTLTPGRRVIRLPVHQGQTTIVLRPLDPPVHRQLSDGDQRPLILGVSDLRVRLEASGTDAPRQRP